MDIVLIGTGNTATILGRKLKRAGHTIVQIYGRNGEAARALAYEVNSDFSKNSADINRTAHLYILAVSDTAVQEVAEQLQLFDKTVVHTAGSVTKSVLNKSQHYGVFYPLQSLRKESDYLPDTPIIIDASDEETFRLLEDIAYSITDKVIKADDEQRMKLHLAAVYSNNFVNYLYTLAEEYCNREGLDFKLLIPLIKETALRLQTASPSNAQTGPAFRHDAVTIQNHEALLKNYPHLKKFYLLFTESIWNQKK